MKEGAQVNQRSFNVFEVLGNFPLDSHGNIIDRERVILEQNFLDNDGLLVNEKGYLINEENGAIRSRYTYDDLFMPDDGLLEDLGELPMPFRIEKFNFNPHRIMGCFQFNRKTKQPIIKKDENGVLVDLYKRPVNECGFLINEREDIIDNMGYVKFKREQLTSKKMNLPDLINFRGECFEI